MIYKKFMAYKQKLSKQDRINKMLALMESVFANNRPEEIYDMAAVAAEARRLGVTWFYLECKEKSKSRGFFKNLFNLGASHD